MHGELYTIICSLDDDDDGITESTEWLSTVNRGGLIKICDSFFQFLVDVEVKVREHFPAVSPDTRGYTDENLKQSAIQSITSSENILFHWEMISVNWCTNISKTLLKIVLEHYITIRGFSFVKGFMEKYKQQTSRSTQKSKGLRKNVKNSTPCRDE